MWSPQWIRHCVTEGGSCYRKKKLSIEISICIEDINRYEYFTSGYDSPSMDWVMGMVQICFLEARRSLLHVCWCNGGVKWRSNFEWWSQARKFMVIDS